MDNATIIREHRKIYGKLEVLPNIQEHMLRVAAVISWLCERWKGPAIDKELLIACGLVHDIGNIAKADFNWPGQEAMMGAQWMHKDHWIAVQKKQFEQFGTKEHGELTKRMLITINVPKPLLELTTFTGFTNNVRTKESDDWHAKTLVYADCRVGPTGVLSLHERMEEAKERYKHRDHEGLHETNAQEQLAAIFEIEKQLAPFVSEPFSHITDESIEPYIQKFN